jgi:PKD repeat protein
MRSSLRRGSVGVVSGALAVLCACSGLVAADADAAWLPPVPATAVETRVEEPQVAIDAAGNTTVVWTSGEIPNRSIRSAFRPAGGSWEVAFTRITSTFDCHDSRLAVNAAGAAALVAECEKPSPSVRGAYRPAASWNGSLEIAGSGEGNAPRVGIAPNGDADALWSGPSSTVVASHRPAAGSWSSGASISPGLTPNLAVSPGGYAFAIWREGTEVKTSRRSPGTSGTWSATAFKLNALGSVPVGEPQIAIGINGQRMMAWNQQATNQVMAERTSSGDLFGINEPAVILAESGDDVEAPQIAVDGTGLGVAAWRANAGGTFPMKAATTSLINGGWLGRTTLGGATTGTTEPALAVSPAGRATAVWQAGGSVFAATRPSGGAFLPSSPVLISSAAQPGFVEAAVAMASSGDAVSAWPASANRVAIAVDDVTPPSVSAAGPANAEVGAPVPLTATASDTWSPPVALSWDFGDGGAATGGAVSHVYATPGVRTATVTATDAAGNSASVAIPITVTSAGTPAAGGPKEKLDKPKVDRRKVSLAAKIVPQSWKKIAAQKGLKLRCKLDVDGTCSVKATVSAGVAKRIGLTTGKGKKPVGIGSGSSQALAEQFAAVKVKLKGKALAAIAAATAPVRVSLAVTGTAHGRDPATTNLKQKIRRP